MVRGSQCNREGAIAKVCLVCLVSPFFVGSPWASALAQQEAEPIRLVYHASSDCPDEAAFVARVRGRTARVRLAWAGEAARTFTVVVDGGRAPLGRVVVQNSDRREATRQVRADTCSDVVDALALMVALAIDPGAMNPASTAALEAPSAAASASASSSAPVTRSRGDGGVLGGVDFALATDVLPQVILAGSPYVGWRATGERLFAPSFRLAFILARGTLGVAGATATFTWTVGRLDGCPVAWPRGVVRVSECVRVEAGTLEAAGGMGVTAARSSPQPWVSVGAVARTEWSFLPPVFIDAEAGALVPVTDDRFYFNPGNTTAFEVPPIGVTAGVGVGVLFF